MIRLLRYGQPSMLPPLLAIPGIDGSVGSIEPIVEKLSRHREVVVVDYSGELNPSLEALVTEIANMVKTELPGRIDILGQSIGTILSAQLASLYSLPVRKLVLCCTFTKLRWKVLKLSNFSLRMTPVWLYKFTSPLIMALVCGPVRDGWHHPFFASSKKSHPQDIIRRTAWEINRDFSADLIRISLPTLILMGEKDRFVPNVAHEIAKLRTLFASRRATITPIPECGHVLIPSDAIAKAVTAIEEFL